MTAACPYCRAPLDVEDPGVLLCSGCSTPHHSDCYEENGGCTVFGCSAAPAPEPKVSLGGHELQNPAAPAPPPAASSPAPPPPLWAAPQPSAMPPVPPLFSSTGYAPFQPGPSYFPTSPAIPEPIVFSSRNRTTFLLLGIILGAFGVHSFYLGSTKKGWIQLLLTVLTFGFAGLMVWIWAIIDVCTISTDHAGYRLQG